MVSGWSHAVRFTCFFAQRTQVERAATKKRRISCDRPLTELIRRLAPSPINGNHGLSNISAAPIQIYLILFIFGLQFWTNIFKIFGRRPPPLSSIARRHCLNNLTGVRRLRSHPIIRPCVVMFTETMFKQEWVLILRCCYGIILLTETWFLFARSRSSGRRNIETGDPKSWFSTAWIS